MTNYEKVQEFHDHFNCRRGITGVLPPGHRVMLRTRLMVSELSELIEAMQLEDYPNVAKELADVLYVVYGTADEYGIPMEEVFEAVHRSNMSKNGTKDVGGKITKGKDYVPPDIEAVLQKALHERKN